MAYMYILWIQIHPYPLFKGYQRITSYNNVGKSSNWVLGEDLALVLCGLVLHIVMPHILDLGLSNIAYVLFLCGLSQLP